MGLTIEQQTAHLRTQRLALLRQPGSDLSPVYPPRTAQQLQNNPRLRQQEIESIEGTQEYLRTRPNM